MNTVPIESKLYMDGDRLMLSWTGCQLPTGVTGTFAMEANCGGVVDVSAHIEQIIRRVVLHPDSGSAGGR